MGIVKRLAGIGIEQWHIVQPPTDHLVNILARVSNINHHVVQTFEDTVKVDTPSDLLDRTKSKNSVYWKALAKVTLVGTGLKVTVFMGPPARSG